MIKKYMMFYFFLQKIRLKNLKLTVLLSQLPVSNFATLVELNLQYDRKIIIVNYFYKHQNVSF